MTASLACRRFEELLSEHIEGTLGFAQKAQVDAHLAACPSCRELRAAMEEVIEALRAPAEIEPAADLAERAASAALRAGRTPPRVVPLPRLAGIPHRILATAAVLTLALSTGITAASGGGVALGAPSRLAQRVSALGVAIAETKDRLLESIDVVRVIVGTAFEGRVDRVNDRLDDYKRLLERRQQEEARARAASPAPGNPNPGPAPSVPESENKERTR
jgi:anti-sigma factor RsiW